jgi:hypothetical protein
LEIDEAGWIEGCGNHESGNHLADLNISKYVLAGKHVSNVDLPFCTNMCIANGD